MISARRNCAESIGTGLNVADALLVNSGAPRPLGRPTRTSAKPRIPLAPVETIVRYQATDDDLPTELFEAPTQLVELP